MTLAAGYLDVVLPDTGGYVAVALGRGGHHDTHGTYRHREWHETAYRWPDERDALRADVAREHALGEAVDVYICPAVRSQPRRRKGDAAAPSVCWVDLDGPPADAALARRLDGYTVASGQPGHVHLYVPLSTSVTVAEHAMLNRALAAALGGDAKWSDETLLRLPGTCNHKTTPPGRVAEPAEWGGTVWEPAELAAVLGVDLDQAEAAPAVPDTPETATEPLPEPIPARVRRALDSEDTADRSKATARLAAACYDAGLSPGQALSVCADYPPAVAKYGSRLADEVRRWWAKLAADRAQPAPLAALPGHGALDVQAADGVETLSDNGNASALVATYGPVIRYCIEAGTWLHWTGRQWQLTARSGGMVRELFKHVAAALPESTAAEHKHKVRSHNAPATDAALRQASSDPRVTVQRGQLDAKPMQLNTPAGIVDLASGQLVEHDASAHHTKMTAADPTDGSDDGPWLRFLDETFGGDAELITYVQRLVGLTALGEVREHVLPFCYGEGGNGKGAFLESIHAVLGDYGGAAPERFLMVQSYPKSEEIAHLAGQRMVLCSEINTGEQFDEAKVKKLTGGDTLTARELYQNLFTFTPSHTLWLHGNDQPKVGAGGRSFWRRLRLIPFLHTVTETDQVEDLQGILASQHGGALLNWIIRGAVDYLAHGLNEPDAVRSATREYAAHEDTLGRFVDECCHVAPGSELVKVRKSTLRERYDAWCRAEGEQPLPPQRFGRDLRSRFGVEPSRSRNPQRYLGIMLTAETDEDGDPTW